MKQRLFKFLTLIVFTLMLFKPQEMFAGACQGLLLWFKSVLPTLFPFVFITDLLLYTDSVSYISKIFAPVLSRVFRTSKSGCFAVLCGFFCGCPAGAKLIADMAASGRISKEEGGYLLSFCNNLSPAFIINFIVVKALGNEALILPALTALFGAPVFMSFILRRFYLKGLKCFPDLKGGGGKSLTRKAPLSDICILDAFESVTKAGGYIILFSALIRIMQSLPLPIFARKYILPCLEVTNGINMVGNADLPFPVKYQAILTLTAFGGVCAAAQTASMVKKAGIPMDIYITEKLTAALTVSFVTLIYLKCIYG